MAVYKPMGIPELKDKFVTKKLMDLKTNRGLEEASYIMLNEIYANRKPIDAGQTAQGFIVFNLPSSQATKITVNLILEKEPQVPTAAYERLIYKFDYTQDLVKRAQQPPIKRY